MKSKGNSILLMCAVRRFLTWTAALAGTGVLGACSAEHGEQGIQVESGCALDDCGSPCVLDADCPGGLHCRVGGCSAECSEAQHCDGGVCSEDGRCVTFASPGHDDFKVPVATPTPDPEEVEPEICAETQAEFEVRIPQVWFILDRSGSMNNPLSSEPRWAALGDVLFGDPGDLADVGVVGTHESQVSFGATYFDGTFSPSTGSCRTNLDSVPISLDNYESLRQQYEALVPGQNTPTADAVVSVAATAAAAPATSGPKILILATDGEPTCGNSESDVENAVEAAFADQLVTFAVFLGPPSAGVEAHLQRVANVGTGRSKDASNPAEFFKAEDPDKLREAFDKIIGSTRGCIFDLDGEVAEDDAKKGTVRLNGNPLRFEDPDGWQLASTSQVELVGAACEEIKDGATMLDIKFPCDVFTPSVVR